MAVQFLPIIKAALPYVAQIATVAIPAFTKKPEEVKVDPVVTQQIEELQTAATQNANSIHVLAEKMKLAIQGFEAATEAAKRQVQIYKMMLLCSLFFSIVSFVGFIYLLLR